MNDKEFEHTAIALRPRLTELCRRFLTATSVAEEADDLVQETLLRLWRMRDRMEDYRSVEALAVMVAKNVCIDCLRRSRQTAAITGGEALPSADGADRPLMADEMQRLVDKALRRLPATQRRLLGWRSEGLGNDEIADICGMTRQSVKTLLSDARKNMPGQMKGYLK